VITTFKKWWNKEREDRVEKNTSQDIYPTNGTALTFIVIMVTLSTLLFFFGVSLK